MGSAETNLNQPEISLPNGAYRAIDLIKSERLVRSLSHVLANTVVVENLQVAHLLLQSNSELRVVTRDGDILGRDLVVGGSKSESSLIELRAVIDESEKSLRELTHNG